MSVERFLTAQNYNYETALGEIRRGRKQSHWMWYIFPQIKGLGYSDKAKYYAVQDRTEAEEYMNHPVLAERLIEICEALLAVDSSDAESVLGWTDAMKLKSSMTLFGSVSEQTVFQDVLDKFFDGERDGKTLEIMEKL